MPTPWEGFLWGILPIGSSILAIFLVVLIPDRRTASDNLVTIPARAEAPMFAREVRP
jgi:hypothetical protein